MAVTTRRKGTVGLPPLGHGMGDWWQLKRETPHRCTACGHAYRESVAVLEYLPALDVGGMQCEQHPGWDVLGWLAWWDCPACGARVFEVVTTQTVARWGRTCGGWYHEIDGV